jgi:3-phosphoshikimate 1-carboxyvinyltransferase
MHSSLSRLHGQIQIPSSKSHTLRAILFASLAIGKSKIQFFLPSPDTFAMIKACEAFGAKIKIEGSCLSIQGVAGKPFFHQTEIDAGNSGQVLRFIGAIAGLAHQKIRITGDESIQTKRPVLPLLDGLLQFGCQAYTQFCNDYAPIFIEGPFTKEFATIDGRDSQPVSGLLIARAFANSPTVIEVTMPGETPWVHLTLDWFQRLGIPFKQYGFTRYELLGHAQIQGFDYEVPGDFSSCAFPMVAAILTNSEILLNNLNILDSQGDKKIIDILRAMGAQIEIMAETQQIKVHQSPQLKGLDIDVNDMIDALPILSVVACFAEGSTHLKGAKIAKNKESDRLEAMCSELKKLGAQIQETDEGLKIFQSQLHSGIVNSHHDHRVAMALAVAGLTISKGVYIQETQCIAKSFPNFMEIMNALGAHIV